jgi:pentapeptide repeat protein
VSPRESKPPRGSRRRRLGPFQSPLETAIGLLTLVLLLGAIVWFAWYLRSSEGAERQSALFAAVLVAAGSLLLAWSYVRRPPVGEDDDFLDKLLAGTGQALLLGAILSFGFGLVNRQLSAEQASRDLRRNLATQVRAAASDSRVFPGVDLSGSMFRGLDLSGFDFSFSDLSAANLLDTSLRDANLFYTKLRGANLGGSDLSGATLTSADLSSAVLNRVDFTGATLTSAKLTGALLRGAIFVGVDLRKTDLSGVYCDTTTRWPGPPFQPPECLDPADYRNPYR